MPTSVLSLHITTPTTTITKPSLNNNLPCRVVKRIPCRRRSIRVRASSSSSSDGLASLDLYDLLGVDSSSEQREIKSAYRALQKRCHPDIAGAPGHDMAIILNDVYALLSDPSARLAYDKTQEKTAELRGYTGKPLYSVWFGAESEERAVFVDELKCVGCLKCALFAEKTFAIESVYGRARVVAQWADPENKIQEAIETCPVDCISFVERSNLAALEFLMSKQPRGNVRVGASHTAGARTSNIFTDLKKFHLRYQEARGKTSTQNSQETDLQRSARMSAIQAIRSISSWMYWKAPSPSGSSTKPRLLLTKTAHKSPEPDIKKLREAVAARKMNNTNQTPKKNNSIREEYWVPSPQALPSASAETSSDEKTMSEASSERESKRINDINYSFYTRSRRRSASLFVPSLMGIVAATIIRLNGEVTVGQIEEHFGGSMALEIVNSSWLPVILTGVTWYVIGILAVGFAEAIRSRES